MTWLGYVALVAGTWELAAFLAFPLARKTGGAYWAEMLCLSVGLSGSIAAFFLLAT